MFCLHVSIFISVVRETSGLMEKCGDGSSPSEAHGGGQEGLGRDGGEPALQKDYTFMISCHKIPV